MTRAFKSELANTGDPIRGNASFGIPKPLCFKCNIVVDDLQDFRDPKYPDKIGLVAKCHGETEICFIHEDMRFLMSLSRGTAFMPKEYIDQWKDPENCKTVLANDNDIKRQVPGILQDHTGTDKPDELRNEELFNRAINR